MGLCEKCRIISREYDEFRQNFDDVVKDGEQQKHFCSMYDGSIPNEIYYGDAKCEWYEGDE